MAVQGGDTVPIEESMKNLKIQDGSSISIGCWNINGTGKAKGRKEVISYNLKENKDLLPEGAGLNVLFLQEVPVALEGGWWGKLEKYLSDVYADKNSVKKNDYYCSASNEKRNKSAVLIKKDHFDITPETNDTDTWFSETNDSEEDITSRIACKSVTCKASDMKFKFISYHNPKKDALERARKFFQKVNEIDKSIAVLIGGDFNTDISKNRDELELDPYKYEISEYKKVWPRNRDERKKIDFIVLRKPAIEGLTVELENIRAIVYSTLPKIKFWNQLGRAFSPLEQDFKDHSSKTGQEQEYIERGFSQLDGVKKDCMRAVDNFFYKSDPPLGDGVTNHSPVVATLEIYRTT